jgi:hypothetical protein
VTTYYEAAIPPAVLQALKYHIERKLPYHVLGGFVQAVLANDLREAVGRADSTSLLALLPIVRFLWNEAPADCWGSLEKAKGWWTPPADTPPDTIQEPPR